VVEWLKVKALSSNPSTAKKKREMRKRKQHTCFLSANNSSPLGGHAQLRRHYDLTGRHDSYRVLSGYKAGSLLKTPHGRTLKALGS
jgi:hypothetical protein